MRNSLTMAGALVVALTAFGCGGGGGGGTSTPTAPTSGGSTGATVTSITITGQNGTLAFNPNPANVSSGAQVQFKNNDSVTHHIMMDDGSAQTADIPPGATSAAISVGSNKSYHCAIHPGMVGGFNGSTGDPPPNCSYQYCAGYGGG
jgi:plastocyanin